MVLFPRIIITSMKIINNMERYEILSQVQWYTVHPVYWMIDAWTCIQLHKATIWILTPILFNQFKSKLPKIKVLYCDCLLRTINWEKKSLNCQMNWGKQNYWDRFNFPVQASAAQIDRKRFFGFFSSLNLSYDANRDLLLE